MSSPAAPESAEGRRLGSRVAWAIFALCCAVELYYLVQPNVGELGRQADLFFVDVLMAIVAPLVCLVVYFVLPRAARPAFRHTSVLCAGVAILLWGGTCGLTYLFPYLARTHR
jgi:hypothetical protein